MSIEPLLPELRGLGDGQLREQLAGNLCRCTGYQNIVDATRSAICQIGAPRRVIVEHELPGVTWAQLAGAGPAWPADAANFSAVVEVLDLDDDERVANLEIRGRERGGLGQLRGIARASADGSGVRIRAELNFLATATTPDQQELKALLTSPRSSARASPAPRAEPRSGYRRWTLLAGGVVAWLAWHALRRRR